MTRKTFKYYMDENGEPKVEMSQDAARDVVNAKDGFEACALTEIYDKPVRELRTAEHIASRFLADKSDYEATKSAEFITDSGTIFGYKRFLNAVEAKIYELLG